MEALMKKVGCLAWPERWNKIYEGVMRRYEKEGCLYANPEFYEGLEARYHSIGVELEVIKRGAVAVGENDALCRLLALITEAFKEPEYALEDMMAFELPKAPAGEDPFPYEILIGLATFSRMDYTYNKLKSKAIPDDMIQTVMGYFCSGLRAHRAYHGREGYENFRWQQKIANAHLLPIGRFNIEIAADMPGYAQIFKNEQGEDIALAHEITLHKSGYPLGSYNYEEQEGSYFAAVEETEEAYIGYPYLENGFVAQEKISLLKSEWKKVLCRGDKAIALHIPRDKKFSPEIVDESLKMAIDFIKNKYPEEWCGVFRCKSWMCDPQLTELLPESSNIVSFCKRFKHLAVPSKGRDALEFIFHTKDENLDYDKLPEDTSLMRAIKAHYKSGKAIYEPVGYFFAE